jgi:hypothetical protein
VSSVETQESDPGGVTSAPGRSSVPSISPARKAVPFVIAAALLGFVAWRIDFGAFFAALRGLNAPAFLGFVMAWHVALLGADALGNFAAYRLTMPNVRYWDFCVFRAASYLPGMVNHHLGQAYMTYLMSKLAGIPLARVAGATLVSYAGWMACLLGCVTIALPVSGLPLGIIPVILVAGIGYLAVIALKPARLVKVPLLAPLFEAGLRGHAVALVARLPHLCVLVFGSWAAYFFFDVRIPLGTAMVYLPILLVATTLPITPQGFGTREALAGSFFARFAAGDTEAERLGRLTACSTAWGVGITLAAVLLGLFCSRIVARRLAQAPGR